MKDYVIVYVMPARYPGLHRTPQMTLEEAQKKLASEGYTGHPNDPERSFRRGETEANILKIKNF